MKISSIHLFFLLFFSACATSNYSENIEENYTELSDATSISVPSIQLIHLASTDDANLGEGFRSNVGLIHNVFQYWAEQNNMGFKEQILQGKEANAKRLYQTLADLKVDTNDVLVFYYSGHAVNDTPRNIWPSFLIPLKEEKRPNMLQIHELLKQKKARLLLNLADCCNYFTHDSYYSEQKLHIPIENCDTSHYASISHLLNAKGDLMLCSSSVGQYAFTERHLGGIFTNKFANTIFNGIDYQDTSCWAEILQQTSEEVINKTTSLNKEQTPQYLINIKL